MLECRLIGNQLLIAFIRIALASDAPEYHALEVSVFESLRDHHYGGI
jgi:hypothetical protein